MAGKRSYHDSCAAAHALDLVGERWALLVVRELLLGPKRFTDLKAGLAGISPNVLTQRLTELEESGVVVRRKLPPPAAAWIYDLTAWGRELEPAIQALGRWGARSPLHPRHEPIGADGVIVSLRTMFSGAAAGDLAADLTIRLGEASFHALIADGAMRLERGAAAYPDAVLTTEPGPLAGLIYRGLPLEAAEADGLATVTGDRAVLRRFFGLFPLPPVATA